MYFKAYDWSEEYNLNVPVIDNAHRKLFSVARKIAEILHHNDFEKSRYICEEAIKYLIHYTLKHFHEEEMFMLERHYSGLFTVDINL